jgi:single-stranded-DNA-specific exonuclease
MYMKKWNSQSVDDNTIKTLKKDCNISSFLAKLLILRGQDTLNKAKAYLSSTLKDLPNPFSLKNMDLAVDRLISAIEKKEKIYVYGDYDVDGTTATALLIRFFREIGHPISFYIPHRIREGYSLNHDAVEQIIKNKAQVIVTVDNGISSQKEAKHIKDLGVDLIITDHHQVPDQLPEAYAIINPLQKGCDYPSKEICGAGVAFNLLMALRSRLRERGFFQSRSEPNIKKYMDLVALATVADVVPLVGVNRIFVKYGLKRFSETAWPGMQALIDVSGVSRDIGVYDLGFRLGPRLNACGRLYEASKGVYLLTEDEYEKCLPVARELNEANRERQAIEKMMLDEAVGILDDPGYPKMKMSHVLFHESWHVGVLGIVASKLTERYLRPVVLLGKDGQTLKGSARSYGGLNLIEALRACGDFLIRCGGHKAAAGLSLQADQLKAFSDHLEMKVSQEISEADCEPCLNIDGELLFEDIGMDLITDLKALEPFGMGNSEPIFSLKRCKPCYPRVVGEKHLKFEVREGAKRLGAIAFGMGSWVEKLSDPFDVAFALRLNEYNGAQSVELHVRDISLIEK